MGERYQDCSNIREYTVVNERQGRSRVMCYKLGNMSVTEDGTFLSEMFLKCCVLSVCLQVCLNVF